MDSKDPQVQLSFSPDAIKPLIREVVAEVLAHQATVDRTREAVQAQLLYTEEQAAKKLGLTTIALKEERLKGRIQYLKRGKQIKYLPDHLVEYVANWADVVD